MKKKYINFKKLFIQIFIFGIVGVIATLIDFAVLFLLKEVCNVNTLIANTISFIISVIFNYIASVKWVFDVNNNKDKKKTFITFIIFSIIGLILNDIIMYLCIDKLNIYYMISKIVATIFVMIFNFVTRKMFLE